MHELILGGKLNLVAFIDDEDVECVCQYKWHPQKSLMDNGTLSTWYVMGGHNGLTFLHRFILQISDPKIKVDHKDRNGLNNQRSNLRCGTQSQNLANRPKSKLNTSGYKGVYRSGKIDKPWLAAISFQNKTRSLGTFATREEAALAYDKAALGQWGDFAYLNFPRIGIALERGVSARP